MASSEGILMAFAALQAADVREPATWKGERPVEAKAATVATWATVLRDIDDRQLSAAVQGWLASAVDSWWPMPGAIRKHAPPCSERLLSGPSEPHSPYNDDLDDWGRQQVLDQADRENWWNLDTDACWFMLNEAATKLLEGDNGVR